MTRSPLKQWMLATVGVFFVAVLSATAATPRPNIVFILADDLGYMDINAYATRLTGVPTAEQFFETPNLDRLVSDSTAFSQAYACQLCSPTRAGLLTGRNNAKVGVMTATPGTVKTFYNQGIAPPPGYLAQDAIYWGDKIDIQQALLNGSTLDALPAGQPLDQGRDEITLAEVLAGYHSAFIGKWHLGAHGSLGWQPHNQGFEELAYFDDGGSIYFNWRKVWDNRTKHFPKMPQPELVQGKTDPATRQPYLTDALTDTAVNFLAQRATNAQPFFLYFCEFAVHAPFQAKPADIAHFESKATRGWNGQSNAVYAAMLKSLDESVGRVLDELHRTGLETNTLVVFMSDNGGVTYTHPVATCNAPLKGGKGMLFEGGIRVPLLFHWPGHISSNQWCNVPVTYEDLFSTLLELSGENPEPHYESIDGRCLKSLLADPANHKHGYRRDTFYWHYPFNVAVNDPEDGQPLTPHSAIREGDYKLIFDWSGRLLLYNEKTDWREEHNLAAVMPDKAKAMFKDFNVWLDANVAVKYTPAINPDYEPAKALPSRPFTDLRAEILGEKSAIRQRASDPRFKLLSGLDAPPPQHK